MITIRRGVERGHKTTAGSTHSIRFRFQLLRPAHGLSQPARHQRNRVAPGQGFGTHPHNDMEIISYVVEGRSSIGTRWATDR